MRGRCECAVEWTLRGQFSRRNNGRRYWARNSSIVSSVEIARGDLDLGPVEMDAAAVVALGGWRLLDAMARGVGFGDRQVDAAVARSVRTSSPRPWARRKSSSISAMESSSADQSHSSSATRWITSPRAARGRAAEQARAHDDAAMGLEDLWPDHEVGDAVFVLDGDEHHARGGTRPLANQDQAGQGELYLRSWSSSILRSATRRARRSAAAAAPADGSAATSRTSRNRRPPARPSVSEGRATLVRGRAAHPGRRAAAAWHRRSRAPPTARRGGTIPAKRRHRRGPAPRSGVW